MRFLHVADVHLDTSFSGRPIMMERLVSLGERLARPAR